jgi:hypothetical protein
MADDPNVVQIPVTRYDVNLTLQDLMTPLTTFAERHGTAPALANTPGAQQHAADLANLARQILTVAGHIDAVAPHLLAPTPPATSPSEADK